MLNELLGYHSKLKCLILVTHELTPGATLLNHNGLSGVQLGDRDQVLEPCFKANYMLILFMDTPLLA